MKRRDLFAMLGGTAATAALPVAASALQGTRVRGIAVLAGANSISQPREETFKKTLAALGWIEGRNLRIDCRPLSNDLDRIRAAVAEVVGRRPCIPRLVSYLKRECSKLAYDQP
jgi:hypothetical protein